VPGPDSASQLDQDTHPMQKSLPTVLAIVTAALLTTACGDDREGEQGPGAWGGGRPPAVVTTAPAEQGAYAVDARFVGTLEATTAADLYARTSGPIVEVRADDGDPVREGELLARIQPDEAEKQVEQSRAALRIAEATLAQREANLGVARATAERTRTLFDQDLVSRQDYDSVQAELVGAESQLELARAQIEQARANLSGAQLELAKTRVIAPFAGWVGKRHLDLGDFAATTRPVFSIVDLSIIETAISITEKDAARIHVGQAARVTTQAYPDEVFIGQVARIASIFDPQTNTTEAEIEVANPDSLLKPGMFADVSVTYRTEPTAILVPASAVVEGDTESHVYVAERAVAPQAVEDRSPSGGGGPGGGGDGPRWVARRIPVRVVGTSADGHAAVEVEGAGELGLEPGARVIVLGQQSLTDGAPVVLSDAGPQPAAGPAPREVPVESRS
jgi:HlyD family secretion protein